MEKFSRLIGISKIATYTVGRYCTGTSYCSGPVGFGARDILKITTATRALRPHTPCAPASCNFGLPRCRDLAILLLTTTTTMIEPITLPLAHVCRAIICVNQQIPQISCGSDLYSHSRIQITLLYTLASPHSPTQKPEEQVVIEESSNELFLG